MDVADQLKVRDYISISHRHYFSIGHIQTAAYFSRESAKIEDDFKATGDRTSSAAHQGYVTGAIFFAVSFLEAAINEIFCDASDSHPENLKEIDAGVISLMAKLWARGVPRTASYNILEKYEIALDIAGKSKFETSKKPYQDIQLLSELRNALVHYETEWIVGQMDDRPLYPAARKLGRKLRGKFNINPLTGEGNPFYPDKCLGHGCAAWAVLSSIVFADE